MTETEIIPDKAWLVLGAFVLLISLYCLVQIHTRHRGVSLPYRLLWSCVVFLPLLGPMLYGALFSRIAPNPASYASPWWDSGGSGAGRRLDNPWDGYVGDTGGEGATGGDGGGGD